MVKAYVVDLLVPQSLEPVMVIVYVPVGAEDETVTVIVEDAVEPGLTVTGFGLKLTVTPEGAPEEDSVTVMDEAEPLVDVT
jgi:hypothetical protein